MIEKQKIDINQRVQTEERYPRQIWSTQKLDRMYNIPPNFTQAMIHKQATKFGYKCCKIKNEVGTIQPVPLCPCCGNYTVTYEYPMCYPTNASNQVQNSSILTSQAISYFSFIKYLISYLLFRFLIIDLYSIYIGIKGDYCDHLLQISAKDICYLPLSAYNLYNAWDQESFLSLDILNFISVVFSAFYIALCYFKLGKNISYSIHENVYINDFSICLTNLPRTCMSQTQRYEQVIKKQLQKAIKANLKEFERYKNEEQLKDSNESKRLFWKYVYNMKRNQITNQPAVISVNLVYNLAQIQQLQQLRKQSLKLQSVKQIKQKNKKLNQIYVQICEQFARNNKQIFYIPNFTGTAFVTFRYQYYRSLFIKDNNRESDKQNIQPQINLKGSASTINQILQPGEINWSKVTPYKKQRPISSLFNQMRMYISWIIGNIRIVIVTIFTLIILAGAQIWNHYDVKINQLLHQFSYLPIIFLIFALNKCMPIYFQHEANKQKLMQKRDINRNLFYNTQIYQVFTTIVFFYIVDLYFPSNPLGKSGIAIKVISFITINTILNIVYDLIGQLFSPCRESNDLVIQNQTEFQQNFNKKYQYPQFKYWKKYNFYIINTLVVSVFSFFIPYAPPILIITFIIQYWIDKYILFKKSKFAPESQLKGHQLKKELMRGLFILMLINVIFAMNYCICTMKVNFEQNTGMRAFKIITLIFAFVEAFVVFFMYDSYINNIQNHNDSQIKQQSDQKKLRLMPYDYYQQNNIFSKTYDNVNPLSFCKKQKHFQTQIIPKSKIVSKIQQNQFRERKPSKEINEDMSVKQQYQDANFIKQTDFTKYLNILDENKLFSFGKKYDYKWKTLKQINF